ncbi:ATP-binding protein, partial [Legionella worsleiensis]
MLNNPTLDKLRSLKLTGMADAFTEQLKRPVNELDFEERLGLLVEREYLLRDNRKMERRLKQARLQLNACMEDIDFKHPRGLNKSAMLELFRCQWVSQHLNLLITGPTGCGKTYIACALAHKACITGFSSRYYRLPRLWNELKIAKANGSYPNWLASIAKVDVLVLDDWGLVAPDEEQRRDLLEILEDRYQKRSTIITS